MSPHTSSPRLAELDTRLVAAGAALTVTGAVLAMAGLGLAGAALAWAGRRWVRQLETPPSELAAAKLHQARHASQAGLRAWQEARPAG